MVTSPHYDPVTKQSRPKRKYLGTIDPETGELIPSSGRRGRTASITDNAADNPGEMSEEIAKLRNAISEKDSQIADLKAEVKSLQRALKSCSELFDSISTTQNQTKIFK